MMLVIILFSYGGGNGGGNGGADDNDDSGGGINHNCNYNSRSYYDYYLEYVIPPATTRPDPVTDDP